jgi:hypothetical protein
MFEEYKKYAEEREGLYKRRLQNVVSKKRTNRSQYVSCGFVNSLADSTQIKIKTNELRIHLFPSNYDEMQQAYSSELGKSKATITNWKPIGIVPITIEVDSLITKWKKQLEACSTFTPKCTEKDIFDYPLKFDNVTDKFVALKSPPTHAIAYAVGLYALMLLSYFITKRHTRYPGLKIIFGTGDTKGNEL